MKEVKMYTTGRCAYCASAKALLDTAYRVTPVEIRVDTDLEKLSEMMLLTGRRTVPQIFVGTKYIGGYDDLLSIHMTGKLGEILRK